MTVHNATHLAWEFTAKPTPIGGRRVPFRTQAGYADSLMIVKA
jgi:hypothetical protein